MRVERTLTQLLVREANLQLKIENLKRTLESAYDFTIQACFKSVDDWNYGYIDKANLKRFLRQMGYVSSKMEVVAIIRRFDTDGDAKVNLNEFQEGMRSAIIINQNYSSTKKIRRNDGFQSQLSLS